MVLAPAAGTQPLALSQGSGLRRPRRLSSQFETAPPQDGLGAQPPSAVKISPAIVDRGLYHSADALKEFVDLGDAPSCHVCGAIMTRKRELLQVYGL
ncbi:MAG: hypothetical protein ACRD72_00150 [Candidatus Angelobacter sp.]|jgi:ribonucleoside-diphosphate reductase alpha chain